MQIDWKKVASSAGYKSIKKELLEDNRWHPSDKRFLTTFKWVMARATHYAHHTGKPIEDILLEWETARTYSSLSYYCNSQFPKLNRTMCIKPSGIRAELEYNKSWDSGAELKARNNRSIQRYQAANSTKAKKRWTTKQKAFYAKYGRL